MWNKKVKHIATIVCIVSLFFSCEKVTHTSYRVFISNQSSKNIIVEYPSLIMDTTLLPWNQDVGKHIVSLLDTIYYDNIAPKLSESEFEVLVSDLSIYYISTEGEKVFVGGSEYHCRKLSNWKYLYGEDYKYGLHEYSFVIEDE